MSLQVYILYKSLGREEYTSNAKVSHHQLIFRTSTDDFYCTELTNADGSYSSGTASLQQEFSGKGPRVKLTFETYEFYSGTIYYKSVGTTSKSLKEIKKYVKEHGSQDTIYDVFKNNCQHYVRSVIEDFLKLGYPAGLVETASKPKDLEVLNQQVESSSENSSRSSQPVTTRRSSPVITRRYSPVTTRRSSPVTTRRENKSILHDILRSEGGGCWGLPRDWKFNRLGS
ncbi:unnamed protein product [Didymodactylos carnosus]|uniref:PPPDE domain-containing protein n=2 Tax=Didymodactylos carnosus TaxID=1234261 RepID=A0A8S2F9K6_9BILA|nr:unnamed protein product [Didymodactylos carnosus]CAF4199209.1 unnamed protein product [Didymodactylos carnosus]